MRTLQSEYKRTANEEYRRWLESKFWPLAGREDGDDTAADDTGGDDTDDDTDSDDDQDKDGDDDSDKDGDKDKDGDDSVALASKLAKKEAELAAAQAAVRKAKQDAREARSKAAADSGNWEQVAKEREAELADANERAETAEARAVDAEGKLDDFQREVRVTRIASRLGFKDPADAIALLKTDDTGDDKTAERALRKLAEQKDYLVDQRKASGRAMSGGGNGSLFTKEQLDKMTAAEVNANWEKVQASAAALNVGRG